MADLDIKPEDRGDDRRDRGRNRGSNNNRKRRFEDADNHYDDSRAPPAQRRRHDRDRDEPHHRRPFREPALPKIRRELLNIASSTKLPQDEATDIARLLGDNYDDEELRNEFFAIFLQLIIEQPFKIPFVAAVAFYGNDIKSDIAADAIKRVADRAQTALNAGQWKEFKLLLRSLACLQPLFEEDGVFALLRQLFDTVVDLQSANESDVVGIELVKIILLTIPYALVSGGPSFHEQAKGILESTAIVAGNMVPIEGLIASYSDHAEEKPFPYHSVIGLLQTQLSNEAENGWEFACIPRFHRTIPKAAAEDSLPTAPVLHVFPTLSVPSPVNPGPTAVFPEAFFSLFAGHDIATVPAITDISCSLLRDAIVDTIDQLDFNREAVAKFLIDLDCYWSVGVFAKRGTHWDKLHEGYGDTIVWKSEDMIIDAIFSQLFKLPSPQHKLVYYHSLITQLCTTAPAAIAPSLGRAIRFVYRNIPVMDLELANRFLDWFTHHLSNFEFRWRWAEWIEDLSSSDLHPKKAFIIAALDKEIRLSFAARIRKTVPDEYHHLIPQELDVDKSPDFKYDDPQTPFAAEGQLLFTQFRKKASPEELDETIKKIHEQAAEHGIEEVLVPSTDAFVTAICRLGAKSLSHVLGCIERGKDRLQSVARTSEPASRQIVASVVAYWKNHPGVAVSIIDKLLNYQILAPSTIIQWALGDHLGGGKALTESWIYELVSNTVTKVSSRNRDIIAVRLQKALQQQQVDMVDGHLAEGRNSARELFKSIDDAVRGVADGAADGLMEGEGSGAISAEEGQLIRAWGRRWQTAFLRRAQVEESVIGEEAIEARLRLLAAEADPETLPEADHENGTTAEVPNGDTEMVQVE
ncbi:cap binding protein [Lophiotrema nucula]|uniref:Cap binding protein n=1 Tax=Lophiotrema nucula TaxID=690887 RepID=A0A6A5Z666_9PLEO|nr:cap binding protein [Lophiotrema nucula]